MSPEEELIKKLVAEMIEEMAELARRLNGYDPEKLANPTTRMVLDGQLTAAHGRIKHMSGSIQWLEQRLLRQSAEVF